MLIGAQFNQNLFASELVDQQGRVISGTQVPETSLIDLERKLIALKPQLVRVFFSPHQDTSSPSTRDSFVKTVTLAQETGATINITVQSVAAYIADPAGGMHELAELLDELVHEQGITQLLWLTLQNEPNTKDARQINPPRLNAMYRALDTELLTRGLRSQIRFMAGDLIKGDPPLKTHLDPVLPPSFDALDADWSQYTNEAYWISWMERHMADLVDAYSIHVYWDAISDLPPHPLKFQTRLNRISKTSKPFYVTEFGVRGELSADTTEPGNLPGGAAVEKSKQAAFQHAWFQITAARLNCAGTIKWDAYYATYDAGVQSYYAIGPPVGDTWACYPMYYLLWLFTNCTEPDWQAASVPGFKSGWPAVAEFRGQPAELAIIGLDTRWATKNTKSRQKSSYTLPTGLPTGTQLSLLVWNRDGGGRLFQEPSVTVDRGKVTISVPQHAVFALTTKALPPAARQLIETRPAHYGAVMEPRGRKQRQSAANRPGAKTAETSQNACKWLPLVARRSAW